MKRYLWTAGASLLLTINLFAEVELKGTASELTLHLGSMPKTVNLTGMAELKVPADRAVISLKVVTENKSLQETLHSNQEIRARILNTLKERGFSTNSVQSARFSSTPQYGLFKEKAKSYRVENTVKIKAADEKEFQTVANLVDAIPEVRYDSIEFEHSDKDELKGKAIARAIEKATEKKRLYEDKLGVKLTTTEFVEGNVNMVQPMNERSRYALQSQNAYPASLTSAAGVNPPEPNEEVPTSFGELIFSAAVTVSYRLESK